MYLLNARKRALISCFSLLISAWMYCLLFRMINDAVLFVVVVLSVVINVEFYRSLNDDLFRKSMELIYAVPNGASIHRKIIAVRAIAYCCCYLLVVYIDRIFTLGFSQIPLSVIIYGGTIVVTNLIGLKISLGLRKAGKLILSMVQTVLSLIAGIIAYVFLSGYAWLFNLALLLLLTAINFYFERGEKAQEKIIVRSIIS